MHKAEAPLTYRMISSFSSLQICPVYPQFNMSWVRSLTVTSVATSTWSENRQPTPCVLSMYTLSYITNLNDMRDMRVVWYLTKCYVTESKTLRSAVLLTGLFNMVKQSVYVLTFDNRSVCSSPRLLVVRFSISSNPVHSTW